MKISKNIRDVVESSKFDDLEKTKVELKAMGWKGRSMKSTMLFPFPHLTYLKIDGYTPPKPVFTEPESEWEDTSVLSGKKAFSEPYKLISIDETYIHNKYRFCFYDVEATFDDSFTGVKLEGLEYITCPMHSTLDLLLEIDRRSVKPVIFVAYNDAYDGNMVYGCAGVKRDLKFYRDKSNEYIRGFNSNTRWKSSKTHKENKPDTAIYNPLSKFIRCFDAMKGMIGVSGTLKYHAIKAGLDWTENISSDVYQYCKEDILNTRELFIIHKGCEKILAILALSDVKAISSQKAVSNYKLKHFPQGILKQEFKSSKAIEKYIKDQWDKSKYIKNDDGSIIYKENQRIKIKGGDGGLHSKYQKGWLTEGYIYDIDFSSFYPHIMTSPDCIYIDSLTKKDLRALLSERMACKKTNPIKADSLKLFLNSMYGKLKEESPHYPSGLLLVICDAQLKLLDLLSMIDADPIDINTDGIICVAKEPLPEIIIENFPLTINRLKKVYYNASGNYITLDFDDNVKCKGTWLGSTSMISKIDNVAYNCINIKEMLADYIKKGYSDILPRIIVQEKIKGGTVRTVVNRLPWKFNEESEFKGGLFRKEHIIEGESDDPKTLKDKIIYSKLLRN